jgi:hypothetical protein
MRCTQLPSIGILLLSLQLAFLAATVGPARAETNELPGTNDFLLPLGALADGKRATVLRLDLSGAPPDSAPLAAGTLVALPRGTRTIDAAALEAEVAGASISLPPEMVRVGEVMILRGVPVVPVSIDPAALAQAAGGPLTSARITLGAAAPAGSRGGMPTMAGPPADAGRGVYLMITADAFADALQPLILWKTQAGFDVRVYRTSEIGSSRDAIQTFVRDAYQTWDIPPRYLLLVGDVEFVPTFQVSGNVSDHPYACVDGDDFLPDIFVGRMSAKTPTDVEVQVAKTVHYESVPETAGGDPWFTRALLAAGNLNSSTPVALSRWVGRKLIADGFTATDSAYKSNSPQHPWWDGQLIIKYYVDRGVSLINYRGWAYGDEGWQPPNFWNRDVPTLANGWKLPVVFSIVCHTGNFGNVEIDCFGETWMKAGTAQAPKGAVAFIGTGEHWSHSRWNDRIDTGVIQAICDQDLRELGAILTSAKLSILPLFPTEVRMTDVSDPEQSAEYYCYIYNLLGDPSLELRTGVPRTIHVDPPRSIGFGADAVEIRVTEADGLTALAGARVALAQNGLRIGYGVSDASGMARADVAPATIDPITVTVTGRDLYPWQWAIGVVQEEVSLTTIAAEPVSGEHAVPGREVGVDLRVRNTGTGGLNEASLTVAAPSGVTMLTDTVPLGPIASGATGATLTPLRLRLSPDLEDGARLRLRVTPSVSGFGTLPTTAADLVVEAPALVCTGTTGGDGIFDPGETSDLIVSLRNDGTAAGGALEARLRARVPGRLTILDSTATLAEILPGATGGNGTYPFRVTIADTAAIGTVIPLALHILHAGGPRTVVAFNLVVGDVDVSAPAGPDAHGYYAYDSADIDYPDQAPVYRWVECSPLYGGAGTRLPITDNARGVLLDLPFTFRYYGVDFDTLRVSDNGWASFDTEWWYDIRNWSFPDTWGGASQIAPFWDNLDPSLPGSDGIYAWHDAAQHCQVIEWSRLRNWETSGESSGCDDFQTFELALYDPAYYPTPTGDGEILFQYKQIVNDDWARMYSTVGMEDPSETIGFVYSYGNQYAPGAAPLSPGLAIRITTVPPVYHPPATGPVTSGPLVRVLGGSLTGGETRLLLNAGQERVEDLAIFDATGRRIRDLASGLAAGIGPRTVLWDGRDQEGRRVPSGLYWVRLRAANASPRVRLLVLR